MPAGKSFAAAARLFLLGAGSALTWAALSASPALADDGGLLPDTGDLTSSVIAGGSASEEPVHVPALLPAVPSVEHAPVELIAAPGPIAEVVEHVAEPVGQIADPVAGVISTVEQLAAPVTEPAVALIEPVTAIVEPVVQVAEEALPVPLTVLPVTDELVSAPVSVEDTSDVPVAQVSERTRAIDVADETPLPIPGSSVSRAQSQPADSSSAEEPAQSFRSPAAAHEILHGEPTAALVDGSPLGPSPLGVVPAPSVGASGSGGAVGLAMPPPSLSVLPIWFALTGQQFPGGLPSGPSYDPGSTPD